MKALCLLIALLQAAGACRAADLPQGDPRPLIEQKMRLVEMLVNAQAAKAATAETLTGSERLDTARKALVSSRQALAAGRFDEATQILDAALRSSAQGERGPAPARLADDAMRRSYQNLVEQVATYRASVDDLTTHPRLGAAARTLLPRIDAKSAEARKHAARGEMPVANRLLGEAYQLTVSELSRLRAGEEVVLRLNFATPADEYAYESRRFESSRMLVQMMADEGRAEGDRKVQVASLIEEAQRMQSEANQLASANRSDEAVRTMEQATGRLNRALQLMGVPVY